MLLQRNPKVLPPGLATSRLGGYKLLHVARISCRSLAARRILRATSRAEPSRNFVGSLPILIATARSFQKRILKLCYNLILRILGYFLSLLLDSFNPENLDSLART